MSGAIQGRSVPIQKGCRGAGVASSIQCVRLESWIILCRQRSLLSGSWRAIRPSGMRPWPGGIFAIRDQCWLPRRGLALFGMDRWVRVSLPDEEALSVVLVECSWRLERENWPV